ncbi:MAG: family 10 glycosylhydrolase [Aphanothece sp. CMT-3BRIN-NPC111]|jgi:hypothetical protein|nr:family 10 glycosylhydrolase [Aphanothece sp. CMT-3BRIN-NPC111]
MNSFLRLALRTEVVSVGCIPKDNPKPRPHRKTPQQQRRFYRGLIAALLTSSSFVSQSWLLKPAQAQTTAYCRLTKEAIAQKEQLLNESLKGNSDAQKRYNTLIEQHGNSLQQCRSQTWPQNQAIWLKLYPCDARPGVLDEIMDRIANQGYNQVYLQVFADSQVLLPKSDNPTPWDSVLRSSATENVDLLAQAIQKGRARGLRVYAWLYTMNFGYTYALRADRKSVLARNGKGQTSLDVIPQSPEGSLDSNEAFPDGPQAFIDPYDQQAKIDYYRLVQAIVKRRPDGVLFDYVRYIRGAGSASVTSKVQDLWIYGDAAQKALSARALNNKGRTLIERYLKRGSISSADIAQVDKLYPTEGSPLWQGRNPPASEMQATASQRQPRLQWDLWQLTLAHAVQGILDFVALAMLPAQQQGIKTGVVFFPEGNQPIGKVGFDSRLQAWENFPSSSEWHPMVYGICGNTSCIENQVQRVLDRAAPGTLVAPVLVGQWGQPWKNRPSLEAQMQAIRQKAPQINTVSHFAFSWLNPKFDRDRQAACGR